MHIRILSQLLPHRLNCLLHRNQPPVGVFMGIRRIRRRMVTTEQDLTDAGLDAVAADNQVRVLLVSVGELHG